MPPKPKEKILGAVRPNVGIAVSYQRALDALVSEMQTSLIYWLRAGYKADEPEMAQDKSPARELNDRMRRVAGRWQKKFDAEAPGLAKKFAESATSRSDASLRAQLRKAGLTVQFKMTRGANDALQAVIAENIGLIKSISSEHLQGAQGILMRSVSRGRDLGGMTKELEERYGITRRRAAGIAKDQNNKATAIIQRVRQKELGITEAFWLHNSSKHPRQSHVDANGKRYEIAKGMWIDGEYILPGEKINCHCLSRSIIPAIGT